MNQRYLTAATLEELLPKVAGTAYQLGKLGLVLESVHPREIRMPSPCGFNQYQSWWECTIFYSEPKPEQPQPANELVVLS